MFNAWEFVVGASLYVIAGFLVSIFISAFIAGIGKLWSDRGRGIAWLVMMVVWPLAVVAIIFCAILILSRGALKSLQGGIIGGDDERKST